MDKLLDDLDVSVRDHDWHRVKVAVGALRALLPEQRDAKSQPDKDFRSVGMAAQAGTAETDADPANPNVRPTDEPEAA